METNPGDISRSLATIGMTLSSQHLATFAECETAKAAWDAFAALFKSKSQARRLQLKGELTASHKESGEALVSYMARAKHLRAQLKSVGTDLMEDELCLSVLNGLPSKYHTMATVLITSDKELSLDDMLAKLLVYESRGERPPSDNKAYYSGHSMARHPEAMVEVPHAKQSRRSASATIAASRDTSRRTAGRARRRSSKAPTASPKVTRGKASTSREDKAMWPVQPSKGTMDKHGSWTPALPGTSPTPLLACTT